MNAARLFEGEDNMFEAYKNDPPEDVIDGEVDAVEWFLQFFEVSSGDYPDLDRLVRQRFIERWG